MIQIFLLNFFNLFLLLFIISFWIHEKQWQDVSAYSHGIVSSSDLLIYRLVNKRYSFILIVMKFFILSFLLMIVLSFAQDVDSSYARHRDRMALRDSFLRNRKHHKFSEERDAKESRVELVPMSRVHRMHELPSFDKKFMAEMRRRDPSRREHISLRDLENSHLPPHIRSHVERKIRSRERLHHE